MSSPNAIAAVTATLRQILENPVEAHVTTTPLDLARPNSSTTTTGDQLNLFLYQISSNAALRNMDPPNVHPGERARPPLALNLHYLLTAYSADDLAAQAILGRAMRFIYDHPILDRTQIEGATQARFPDNRLAAQFERVRLTFQPLSLEELSKLWSGFQTQFRLSAAFEASVVLIDPDLQPPAPLPVLTRGDESDRGAVVLGSARPPGPAITDVRGLFNEPQVEPGGTVTLEGYDLERNEPPTIVLERPAVLRDQLLAEFELQPDSVKADRVVFAMPRRDDLPVGIYGVSLRYRANNVVKATSNRAALTLLPTITRPPPPQPLPNAVRDANGNIQLNVTVQPPVRLRRQSVVLLLGGRPVPPTAPDPPPEISSNLTFDITDVQPGKYWLRLRVDGIDSALVLRDQKPAKFNPLYQLTVVDA